MTHAHAWHQGRCRSCGVARCTDLTGSGWRCTLHEHHTEPHRYADGTTAVAT